MKESNLSNMAVYSRIKRNPSNVLLIPHVPLLNVTYAIALHPACDVISQWGDYQLLIFENLSDIITHKGKDNASRL